MPHFAAFFPLVQLNFEMRVQKFSILIDYAYAEPWHDTEHPNERCSMVRSVLPKKKTAEQTQLDLSPKQTVQA